MTFVYQLFERLTAPLDEVPEAEQPYARLMATVMLFFLVIGLITEIGLIINDPAEFLAAKRVGGAAFTVGATLVGLHLARRRHHRKVAVVMIALFNLNVWAITWRQRGSTQIPPEVLLYVLVPLLFSALLFQWRFALFIWLANLGFGLSMFTWYEAWTPPDLLRYWLIPLLFISSLFFVALWQRNLFEERARAALARITARRGEDYFRAVVDNAPDMLAVVNGFGRFRYLSPSVENFLGFALSSTDLWQRSDVLLPADLPQAEALYQQITQGNGTPVTVELRVRHHTGAWHTLEVLGQNLMAHPAVEGYVLHIRDITERKTAEDAVRESEARFRLLVEQAPDAFFVLDDNQRLVDVNNQACVSLGYSREELLSLTLPDLATTPFPATTTWPETGQWTVTGESRRKDGSTFPVEMRISCFRSGEGLRWLALVRDVSERERAAAAMRASEAQRQILIEALPDRVAYVHADLTVLALHVPRDETPVMPIERQIGRKITDILPPDIAAQAAVVIQRTLATGQVQTEAFTHTLADKTYHWEAGFNKVDDATVVVAIRDVRARVRAEQELKNALNQLQLLSRRLVEAQETETRRIAHELHDEIGQALTALKLELKRLLVGSSETFAPVQTSLDIVEHILQQTRNLSRDLHPPMLDDLGLVSALHWYLDQQAQRSGLTTRFSSALLPRLPAAIELTCFRVAQEAVTNIIRHARADNVYVRLERNNGEVTLRISDDGVGFSLEEARLRSLRGESLGLFGMQQRVQLLGGSLEIVSEPGEGTTLTAYLPVGEPPATVTP